MASVCIFVEQAVALVSKLGWIVVTHFKLAYLNTKTTTYTIQTYCDISVMGTHSSLLQFLNIIFDVIFIILLNGN